VVEYACVCQAAATEYWCVVFVRLACARACVVGARAYRSCVPESVAYAPAGGYWGGAVGEVGGFRPPNGPCLHAP
jgi:hypothetical protein